MFTTQYSQFKNNAEVVSSCRSSRPVFGLTSAGSRLFLHITEVHESHPRVDLTCCRCVWPPGGGSMSTPVCRQTVTEHPSVFGYLLITGPSDAGHRGSCSSA